HKVATYQGKDFKLFQKAGARVTYVAGEFYWKVMVEETAATRDYVAPPAMLSCEGSAVGGERMELQEEEVNWSPGTYLPVAEVQKAFGVTGLPRPHNVAPNQPFPHKRIYFYWAILTAAAFVLGAVLLPHGPRHKVHEGTYLLKAGTDTEQSQ